MRRNDWASRMYEVIGEHIHKDFTFGAADCSIFVARVIDAMTDSNYEQQLSETYGDERTALKFIAEHGGMQAAVCSFLGPVDDEGRPMRGDVILFDGGEGESLGIWDGAHIVGMGKTGLHKVARSEIKAFWKVR